MDKLGAIAAASLVSSATLGALMQMLVVKGTVTPAEVREVYDNALFMIERQ